jgi:hypothetical protein
LTILVVILLPAAAAAAAAQENPVGWLSSLREAAGLSAVAADPLLSVAAQRWSAVLAASGVLSHHGADGSSVLDRYRGVGGTEAHVGEIIGAGPRLAAVENGWEGSAEHRGLVRDPAWTHAGWGMAMYRQTQVWVVVFCQKLVDDLQLDASGTGLDVRGAFVPPAASRAALYTGLDLLSPAEWDPETRRFAFAVPPSALPAYLRLGYVSADGVFRITNAFTWPRETVSPGVQDRSSRPAGSP